MNLRSLLTTLALAVSAVGCAGAPPDGTVEASNLRGGGLGGGGGGGLVGNFRPDICGSPQPGPIDLDADWDGKTSLWGNRRGVVVKEVTRNGEWGFFGIDPVANDLVWYGVSSQDRYVALLGMAGSCQPPPPPPHSHPVINQATVGKLPLTPPSSGGGEKRFWGGVDCDDLRSVADAAFADSNTCHY